MYKRQSLAPTPHPPPLTLYLLIFCAAVCSSSRGKIDANSTDALIVDMGAADWVYVDNLMDMCNTQCSTARFGQVCVAYEVRTARVSASVRLYT